MEIRTFWRIVIKGIGLWFLVNTLYIIPQLTATFSVIDHEIGWNNLLIVWLINIVVFFIYLLIVRVFLFKSEWLIDKLKLDNHFTQNKIDINMSSQTVLRIVVIITGALIFVEGLPNLIQEIYQFIQQKELLKNYPETSWLLFHFFKVLFGYLIMTNSKSIEKYINKESSNVQ